ncbi:hypothetical protein ACFO9E_13695 [Streptomyces maoxianensis]|uniref:Uncharacterized protein n=1 Tax=Streptomyces maoxianensis TaxID=1459942 RepID=A0ABV9G8E9_9ACTN
MRGTCDPAGPAARSPLLLAGVGLPGLCVEAPWLGRRERASGTLLWIRTDRIAKGPVVAPFKGFRTIGVAGGDAAPRGARRR